MKNKKVVVTICAFALVMLFSVTAFAGTAVFNNLKLPAGVITYFGNSTKGNNTTFATLTVYSLSGLDMSWNVQFYNGSSWINCTAEKYMSGNVSGSVNSSNYSPCPVPGTAMRTRALVGGTSDAYISGTISY